MYLLPADNTDETRARACAFFDRYEALDESRRASSLRDLAGELGIPWSEAWRWAYVLRPEALRRGETWPYEAASQVQAGLRPADTLAHAARPRPRPDKSGETIEEAGGCPPVAASADRLLLAPEARRASTKALYVEAWDAYVVQLSQKQNPIIVPRELHEAMLSAYSDWDGHPLKIDEIAAQAGLTRAEFERYRSVFGWSRKTAPKSELELAQMDPDEAVRELSRMREAEVLQKWRERRRREDERDADKWRTLRDSVLAELKETIERVPAFQLDPSGAVLRLDESPEYHLILPLNDWQVGLYADGKRLRLGRHFDADVLYRMVDDYIAQLGHYLDRNAGARWGRPYVVLLGDLVHSPSGRTVHGTELLKHMHLFDWEQVRVGLDLLYRVADAVAALFGTFKLISVPGNHEGAFAQVMAEALYQRYHHLGVEKVIPEGRTHWEMIGNSLFVFDHGASPDSGTKGGKIPRSGPARDNAIKDLIYARPDLVLEARRRRGGVYFVQGDQHHTVDETATGYELVKLPAIVSGDVYADENLWYSRPAQGVLLVDRSSGLRHVERFYFDNERVFEQEAQPCS